MNAKKIVNLTKFLLAGALVLGMTACSSDDDITKGGTETDVKTYMTVSISNDAIQRTINTGSNTNNDPNEEGTAPENAINHLSILLVKDGKVDKIITDPTMVTTTTSISGVETKGQRTTPFPVLTGTYKIYVIANPVAGLIGDGTVQGTIQVGMNESALQAYSSELLNYADATNGFMMTNCINYNNDNTNIPSVTVTAANTQTNPAIPSTIKVDRIAVKVRISAKNQTNNVFNFTPSASIPIIQENGSTVDVTNISITGWTLLNTVKSTNTYQQWGNANNNFTNDLKATNFTSGITQAAYNNIMDNYSTRTQDTDSASLTGYTSLKDLTATTSFTPLVAATSTDKNISYCLETNPLPIKSYNNGYTKYENEAPGVLFQATASINNQAPTSFFGYAGKYYQSLLAIQNAYPNAFAAGSLQDAETLTTSTSTEDNHSTLRTKYGIKYYKDGVMYFTKYIRDNNYTTDYSAYGVTGISSAEHYYALIRNSIYDLNIKTVSGIGTDIPFGWNPNETPIDDANTYLKVDIVVNKWALNSYDVNL